ncbi:hypothetical protein [Paracoccus aestuariivivens]|uniref:Uncharacterized protein n=1 Tax=Paracoccus aestuariivivens TaxID=1820333 RepID=A0A6L6JF36_9RHOB|nr:hypothetical protein [Paracoccus aestuariivivens]MTH78541.1 hypothetical protein [Paracoccus aestuariivivens]
MFGGLFPSRSKGQGVEFDGNISPFLSSTAAAAPSGATQDDDNLDESLDAAAHPVSEVPKSGPKPILIGPVALTGAPNDSTVITRLIRDLTEELSERLVTAKDCYNYIMEEAERLSQTVDFRGLVVERFEFLPIEYSGKGKQLKPCPVSTRAGVKFLDGAVQSDLDRVFGAIRALDIRAMVFVHFVKNNREEIHALRKKNAKWFRNHSRSAQEMIGWEAVLSRLER